MTITATAPAPSTAAFKVGDKVRRMRNLDHPTFARRRRTDDGTIVVAARADLSELIGQGIVTEPFRRYKNRSVVVVHGYEYDAVTGIERSSGSTRIELCES